MLSVDNLNKSLEGIYHNNKSLRVLFKNTVSSTNDFFKYKYIKDQCPIIIIANNQRAARGRNNKKWVCLNKKSISFSLCLKLDSNMLDLRILNYLSCYSLLNSFKNLSNNDFWIKWPNDILMHGKKVSGILMESQSYGKNVYLSIGIGINIDISESYCVNQPHSNLGNEVNQSKLISLFCSDFLDNLVSSNYPDVVKQYNENLFGYKRDVSVIDEKNYFQGRLLGINEEGCLIISRDSKKYKVNNINSTLRLL